MNKGDDDKVSQSLSKMMEEDLTLRVENDSANRQTLIYGIGEQNLDIEMCIRDSSKWFSISRPPRMIKPFWAS